MLQDYLHMSRNYERQKKESYTRNYERQKKKELHKKFGTCTVVNIFKSHVLWVYYRSTLQIVHVVNQLTYSMILQDVQLSNWRKTMWYLSRKIGGRKLHGANRIPILLYNHKHAHTHFKTKIKLKTLKDNLDICSVTLIKL